MCVGGMLAVWLKGFKKKSDSNFGGYLASKNPIDATPRVYTYQIATKDHICGGNFYNLSKY